MNDDKTVIKYDDIPLPEKVSDILKHDIWVGDSFSISMFSSIMSPIKFSASAIIFLKRGHCTADLNLIQHDIKAPSIVVVRQGQILTPKAASPDFDASYIVMSKRLTDTIFRYINQLPIYPTINRTPVVPLDPNHAIHFSALHINLKNIISDTANPFGYECVVHSILAFFFRYGHIPFKSGAADFPTSQGRITDNFLKLVQENFRKERFLGFYASELGISPKHLARTVKAQTGMTAVSWIERLVVLEAQVMLKSSNLNIQQISDELNFKSQSFFGKYFKKFTGMSPKEFRNSKP
jgi:AraC-like DNA-binding protein